MMKNLNLTRDLYNISRWAWPHLHILPPPPRNAFGVRRSETEWDGCPRDSFSIRVAKLIPSHSVSLRLTPSHSVSLRGIPSHSEVFRLTPSQSADVPAKKYRETPCIPPTSVEHPCDTVRYRVTPSHTVSKICIHWHALFLVAESEGMPWNRRHGVRRRDTAKNGHTALVWHPH